MKILISLPEELVRKLDTLVAKSADSSRSALINRIIVGFISDLEEKRICESAVGSLIKYLLLIE